MREIKSFKESSIIREKKSKEKKMKIMFDEWDKSFK